VCLSFDLCSTIRQIILSVKAFPPKVRLPQPHLPFFLRLLMVIAQKMEYSVNDQQCEFCADRVSLLSGLLHCLGAGNDYLSEVSQPIWGEDEGRGGFLLRQHVKGNDVCEAIYAAVVSIEISYRLGSSEKQTDFALRADVFGFQDVSDYSYNLLSVNAVVKLLIDVNADFFHQGESSD